MMGFWCRKYSIMLMLQERSNACLPKTPQQKDAIFSVGIPGVFDHSGPDISTYPDVSIRHIQNMLSKIVSVS